MLLKICELLALLPFCRGFAAISILRERPGALAGQGECNLGPNMSSIVIIKLDIDHQYFWKVSSP